MEHQQDINQWKWNIPAVKCNSISNITNKVFLFLLIFLKEKKMETYYAYLKYKLILKISTEKELTTTDT